MLLACEVHGGLSRLEIAFPVLSVDLPLALGNPGSRELGWSYNVTRGAVKRLEKLRDMKGARMKT